jgi:hypothetical protein
MYFDSYLFKYKMYLILKYNLCIYVYGHCEFRHIVPRLEGPTMHPPPDPPRVVSFCAGAPSEWKMTCYQ